MELIACRKVLKKRFEEKFWRKGEKYIIDLQITWNDYFSLADNNIKDLKGFRRNELLELMKSENSPNMGFDEG